MGYTITFRKIIEIIAVLFFSAQLATIIFSIDKGFDIDDEGCLLLMAQPKQQLSYVIFHIQAAPYYIFHWITPNVQTFRIVALVMLVFSAVLLALATLKLFDKYFAYITNYISRISVFFMVLSAGLMPYVYNYKSFSYNLFNSALVMLIIALGIYITTVRGRTAWFAMLIFGSIIALQFFIKFTSSVLLLPAFCLLWVLFADSKFLVNIMRIASAIILGVLLTLLWVYIDVKDPERFFSTYLSFFGSITGGNEYQGTHGSGYILSRYLNDIILLAAKFLIQGWAVLCVLAFFIQRSSLKIKDGLLVFLSVLFLANVFYQGYYTMSIDESHTYNASKFYIYFILFFGSIYLACMEKLKWSEWIANLRFIYLILLLAVLPLLGAFGTSVVLIIHTLLNLGAWVALFVIVYAGLQQRLPGLKLVWNCGILLFIGIEGAQFYDKCIAHIHRVDGSLSEQKYALKHLPNGSHLQVSKPAFTFFDSTYRVLTSQTRFKPGNEILGLYSLGGVAYLLGAYSPGNNLYLYGYPNDEEMNTNAVKAAIPHLERPYILVEDPIPAKFGEALEDKYHFPSGYHMLARVYNPFHLKTVAIWAPSDQMRN